MTGPDSIVIVGGGHAAAQLCAGLAGAGMGAQVHLVCEETHLPYQRPPLSKAYLKNADEPLQLHRSEDWFAKAGISVHLADPAVGIDRDRRKLRLRSGLALPYSRLVLATGARARRLPSLPDELDNVLVLRGAADAQRLRARLGSSRKLTAWSMILVGVAVAMLLFAWLQLNAG